MITRDRAQRMLAGVPRHPADPEVIYASENSLWFVPLLQEGFIKAAIIPPSNRAAFNAAAANITADEITRLQTQDFFLYADGRLIDGYDRNPITTEDFSEFCLEQILRPVKFIERLRLDQERILVEAFAFHPGETGEYLNLHSDPLAAYLCVKGAAMQFLTGPVTPEEQKFIERYDRVSHSLYQQELKKRFGKEDYWESRMCNHETGDLIVFGPCHKHRSSKNIPAAGQLAVSAYLDI